MNINLSKEQTETIALAWINHQKGIPGGFDKVLKELFSNLQFAPWSWYDAIYYAIELCSNNYAVTKKSIVSHLLDVVTGRDKYGTL